MKIEKGTTRIVIILGKFAIKIAKIQALKAFGIALMWKKVNYPWWYLITHNYNYPYSMHYYLMAGIMHNWHEFIFYQRHYFKFLVPTYFSLLGLINIQKAGKKLEMDDRNLWSQIQKIANDQSLSDTHHFSKSKNFTETNEHLQMFDYGDNRSHKVLKKYGDKIYNEFNFSHTRKS